MKTDLIKDLLNFLEEKETASKVEVDEKTVIMGENSTLDSINSVEFILDLEDKYQVSLMDLVVEMVQDKKFVDLFSLDKMIDSLRSK